MREPGAAGGREKVSKKGVLATDVGNGVGKDDWKIYFMHFVSEILIQIFCVDP